jgi:hypothetical protein
VLVKGKKEQFLSWLREGIESGALQFPGNCGPVQWPRLDLSTVFTQATQ